MIEYPPGTPSWSDLASPDPDASIRFYGELLGWAPVDIGAPAAETGGYRILALDGDVAAGVAPIQTEGHPAAWTTYIATADADGTARRAEAAGGRVLMGPMDVMDQGRMALLADAADGAVFGIWQPGRHRGAQAVNRPGALTWNEVDTRDPEAALRFYGEVFGWTAEPIEQDGRVVYTTLKLDGRTIGGLLPMGGEFPAEVSAHWLSYFGVPDLQAATELVERLGGRVVMGAVQMPGGRFSVCADPQGAVFGAWDGTYDPPPGG